MIESCFAETEVVSLVVLLWGVQSRENFKKIKVSDLKMKEKMLLDLKTALNHCSRSCGKRFFRSTYWKNCVFCPCWGWMFDGKLRESKACFWVRPSKQLMIYGFRYVLHFQQRDRISYWCHQYKLPAFHGRGIFLKTPSGAAAKHPACLYCWLGLASEKINSVLKIIWILREVDVWCNPRNKYCIRSWGFAQI